jgi:hypothetical protein
MKLYPRCHPSWQDSELDNKNVLKRGISYVGTGHILPCCWCDYNDNREFHEMGMLDEELKLENVNSVQEIFLSKQWVHFHKTLIFEPEKAPRVCKQRCSKQSIENEINGNDD